MSGGGFGDRTAIGQFYGLDTWLSDRRSGGVGQSLASIGHYSQLQK